MKFLYGIIFELRAKLSLKSKNGVYICAIIFGLLSALVALIFSQAVHLIQYILMGETTHYIVDTFMGISPERRIFSLVVGGVISGLILYFAYKKVKSRAIPYMESVAIGNGYIPFGATMLRSFSAIVSIASGAAIGREGPLVQTAALAASRLGRFMHLSVPRLRLIIACSAAGALSAVFHTPLAGGIFVCEIVIGTMALDILAPILISSCVSYFAISLIADASPVYEAADAYVTNKYLLYVLLLAVISSVSAKLWLVTLSKSRSLLSLIKLPLAVKIGFAGLIVGLIAISYPQIAGNGDHLIKSIVAKAISIEDISILLCLKVFSVALFFAMGTIGGVLTPSLAIGSIVGFLFAHLLIYFGVPLSTAEIIGFSLLGMASFFTTAAAAPLTSLILVIEFTMAGRMIFPLIVGVLVSYAIAKLLHTDGMYKAETGTLNNAFDKPLKDVRLMDIFRRSSDTVLADTLFSKIAQKFLKNPEEAIYVVSRRNQYIGAILEVDILSFIKSKYVSNNVIADDIMQSNIPTLLPEMSLIDAIKVFTEHRNFNLLPIVDSNRKFYGTVSRSDIFMGFNELVLREKLNG
ncbi:MAG: chloride channel protein [Opitutales bacterium]